MCEWALETSYMGRGLSLFARVYKGLSVQLSKWQCLNGSSRVAWEEVEIAWPKSQDSQNGSKEWGFGQSKGTLG